MRGQTSDVCFSFTANSEMTLMLGCFASHVVHVPLRVLHEFKSTPAEAKPQPARRAPSPVRQPPPDGRSPPLPCSRAPVMFVISNPGLTVSPPDSSDSDQLAHLRRSGSSEREENHRRYSLRVTLCYCSMQQVNKHDLMLLLLLLQCPSCCYGSRSVWDFSEEQPPSLL